MGYCGKSVRERLLDGEQIHSFTVLPDGKMLAALVSPLNEPPKVWDVANPDKPIAEFDANVWWEKGMQKMAIRIWEVATGEKIHTFWGHNSDVQSLAFSPNGTMLASGSFEGSILIWDLKPYL